MIFGFFDFFFSNQQVFFCTAAAVACSFHVLAVATPFLLFFLSLSWNIIYLLLIFLHTRMRLVNVFLVDRAADWRWLICTLLLFSRNAQRAQTTIKLHPVMFAERAFVFQTFFRSFERKIKKEKIPIRNRKSIRMAKFLFRGFFCLLAAAGYLGDTNSEVGFLFALVFCCISWNLLPTLPSSYISHEYMIITKIVSIGKTIRFSQEVMNFGANMWVFAQQRGKKKRTNKRRMKNEFCLASKMAGEKPAKL